MSNISRIQRISRYFQSLFWVWLIAIPIIHALIWIGFNHLPASMLSNAPVKIVFPLPLTIRALGWTVSLISGGLEMIMLFTLIRLFRLYEKGKFFLVENVRCFRNLGRLLLIQACAKPFIDALLSVVVTLPNPPGQRQLAFHLSSSEVSTAVIGGMVLLISWVMEEGRKLEDEQALII